MDEKQIDERFIALEMKLAYMEDFVTQLQNETVEQVKIINKLKTENQLMSQRIKEMSDLLEGDIPNRKPPHY